MATRNKQAPARNGAGLWKIVALLFIAAFGLIVIGGLIRFYSFNASFMPATQEQMAAAKAVVEKDLQAHGDNAGSYRIEPSNRLKRFADASQTLIHVNAFNETVRHSYLIDAATGAIGMHSTTEVADWLPKPHNQPSRGWFHARRG